MEPIISQERSKSGLSHDKEGQHKDWLWECKFVSNVLTYIKLLYIIGHWSFQKKINKCKIVYTAYLV